LEYTRFVDTAKQRKAILDEIGENVKQAKDRQERIENVIIYDESDRKNPQDVKWNLNYASLLKFHERHGHARVPVRPPSDGIIKACSREKKGRKSKKSRDSGDEDEEDLDSMGDVSDENSESDDDDDDSVGNVASGLECKIDQELKELMRWASYQRHLYRHTTLTAKRKELLDKVNFTWTMTTMLNPRKIPGFTRRLLPRYSTTSDYRREKH
jgi:hypothetical protein